MFVLATAFQYEIVPQPPPQGVQVDAGQPERGRDQGRRRLPSGREALPVTPTTCAPLKRLHGVRIAARGWRERTSGTFFDLRDSVPVESLDESVMKSTNRVLLGQDAKNLVISDDEIVQRVRDGEIGLFEVAMRRYNERCCDASRCDRVVAAVLDQIVAQGSPGRAPDPLKAH
jgi:hypothetical protein